MTEIKFKVFDIYDMDEVEVKDTALTPYINLAPKLLIKSKGKEEGKFSQSRIHVIERLASRVGVPGHIGKKHKRITSWASGNYTGNMGIVIKAFEIIQKKKNENPVQVFVRAIENCSPRDETTTIEYGGARYPQAVDVSPLRRVNLAIRWLVQGAYQKAAGKKRKMSETLAQEILFASDNNMECYAMQKKNESEKQADSAR